jgi:hypothetical protein
MLSFDALGELDFAREASDADHRGHAYPGGAPPTRADAPTDLIALPTLLRDTQRATRGWAG